MRLLTKLSILIFFIFLIIQGTSAQDMEKSHSLSLEDCILRALKHNLNVKIEVLNPQLSDISVSRSREKFLPELSISFTKRNTNSASYSWLDASDQVETRYQNYSAEVSQFLPIGGSLSVSLNSDETDTNMNFQTINPRFGSTLRLNLSQPLLKNFGLKINRKEIIIAQNNREMSKHRFKTVLLETIYNVEDAYWNLVFNIENLKVKQQSLELAIELLEKNRRSVEIGKLAPIEIKSAEAEVATREADILQAQALVGNSEDYLKLIINLNAGSQEVDQGIIPTDTPVIEKKEITVEQAIQTAFQYRPDLQEKKIDIENKTIEVKYAKNQLLPDLNLQASLWSPGISGTQILYKNDNPLTGEVVGTIPGNASDAVEDAFNFPYENWSVALNLKVPLNTIFSRAQLAQARVTLEQSQLKLREKEQQILLDIKNAVRAVQTNYKRVQAYRIARELTQKKLDAEGEKLRVGRSTNYNLLLQQRDFSTARSNELRAVIDYNLSLAYLDKALGIGLREKNITF